MGAQGQLSKSHTRWLHSSVAEQFQTMALAGTRLSILMMAHAYAFPVSLSATDCGGGALVDLHTMPLKPHTGQKIHVTNNFVVDEDARDGTFDVKVTGLGVVPLKHEHGHLCRGAEYKVWLGAVWVAKVHVNKLNCLLAQKGAISMKYWVELARVLPPAFGNSKFKLTAKSKSGSQLWCVDVKINVQMMGATNGTAHQLDTFNNSTVLV